MSNKKFLLILAALVAIPLVLFYAFFESYEESESLGWSDVAYKNPFLAAQLYLQKSGNQAATSYSLQDILPLTDIDTLIISDVSIILAQSQTQALVQWLEDGGNLIVAGRLSYDEDSKIILPWLDLELYNTDCGCDRSRYYEDYDELTETNGSDENTELSDSEAPLEENTLSEASPDPLKDSAADTTEQSKADDYDETLITRLRFSEDGPELLIQFDAGLALYHPAMDYEEDERTGDRQPFYWRGSDWGPHFVQFNVGNGLLSVLSDTYLWRSGYIDEYDHAFLLSTLVGENANVRFVIGSDMPSLMALLWRYAKEFLISSAFLLVAWLVYRARRLAPAVVDTLPSRRSLMEHIQATARYHWQQKDSQALLENLRHEIKHQAQLQFAGFSQLPLTEQHQRLAQLSQLSPDSIAQALGNTSITSEAVFLSYVKTLKALRDQLLNPTNSLR